LSFSFPFVALIIQAGTALSELADFAGKYDADGIDIYFLNNEAVGRSIRVRV